MGINGRVGMLAPAVVADSFFYSFLYFILSLLLRGASQTSWQERALVVCDEFSAAALQAGRRTRFRLITLPPLLRGSFPSFSRSWHGAKQLSLLARQSSIWPRLRVDRCSGPLCLAPALCAPITTPTPNCQPHPFPFPIPISSQTLPAAVRSHNRAPQSPSPFGPAG